MRLWAGRLIWLKRWMAPDFFHRFVLVHASIRGVEYVAGLAKLATEGDAEADAGIAKSMTAQRTIDRFEFFTQQGFMAFLSQDRKLVTA